MTELFIFFGVTILFCFTIIELMKHNEPQLLKFKRLSDKCVIPKRAHPTDAGLDITATSMSFDINTGIVTYGTDLAIKLPKGHVGHLYPRSSVYKTNMVLCNSVGVVDENYTGEIKFKFHTRDSHNLYKVGDRIGQLVIVKLPNIRSLEVTELEVTDRGNKGFGSSGV